MAHIVVSILLWGSVILTGLAFAPLVMAVTRRRALTLRLTALALNIGVVAIVLNGIAYTAFDRQEIGDLQWAGNGAVQIVSCLAVVLNLVVAIALRQSQSNSTQDPTTDA